MLSENHKVFFDTIEDILEQADEVDKKYLQFDGGVGTTSLILDGVFELSAKHKQFPAKFTQDRLTKFINYLTNKRFPTNIKSAYFLLKLSKTLTDNQVKSIDFDSILNFDYYKSHLNLKVQRTASSQSCICRWRIELTTKSHRRFDQYIRRASQADPIYIDSRVR